MLQRVAAYGSIKRLDKMPGLFVKEHYKNGAVAVCAAVCCSVLQCVAVCRSVSQCVAMCCSHVAKPAAFVINSIQTGKRKQHNKNWREAKTNCAQETRDEWKGRPPLSHIFLRGEKGRGR